MTEHLITVVGEDDLEALLPLMRGYCDFYAVAPPDDELLGLSRALMADRAAVRLAPDELEPLVRAVGFATLFWLWSTLSASRIGLMNDLFVSADARGGGLAERLIAACRERCADRGATALVWQTAKDNHRAQAVYDRVGGHRAEWLDYTLAVP